MQKLKVFLLTGVFAAALFSQSSLDAKDPVIVAAPRFQIAFGSYAGTSYDKEKDVGGVIETKGLFKIDTETGQTWMFYEHLENGKITMGWIELKNLPK